jgi:hypothetical protein
MTTELERRALATLRTINEHETAGEWSIYDLSVALNCTYQQAADAIARLKGLHLIGSGRFVGGTSRYLYSA